MTIKIEREALISVINTRPTWPSSSCEGPSITYDDEFVLVNLPAKSDYQQQLCPELLRCSSYSDEDSLCTSSTLSCFSSDDSISTDRRVSFAPSIVTDEWTRPFTPREDVSSLYYSSEDTNRFRQEYRLERKVLSELSVDPDTFPVESEELSDLICSGTSGGDSPQGRYNISRVVVLHNNKLETFMTPDDAFQEKDQSLSGDFFDSHAFWSGAITWY